jgi:hypothetical protein
MFDLNSQSGVMVVLASIRASDLTASEKNQIRDLVFIYTNGGRDNSVKIALEQKLRLHNIQPVAAKRTAAEANGPIRPFGSSRPVPVFKSSPVRYSPPPQVPAPVVKEVSDTRPTSNSAVSTAGIVNAVVPAIDESRGVVATTPQPELSADINLMQRQTVQAEPVPSSVPVAAPAPSVVADTNVQPSINYLERIKQIKTSVNSRVGNPVNLVDIDNLVGREYMNALLEAMKKLGSGAESEMPSAMARLESSYQAVENTLKNHASGVVAEVAKSSRVETNVTANLAPAPVSDSARSQYDSNPAPAPVDTAPAFPSVDNTSKTVVRSSNEPKFTLGDDKDLRARDSSRIPVEINNQPPRVTLPNTPNVVLDVAGSDQAIVVGPPTPSSVGASWESQRVSNISTPVTGVLNHELHTAPAAKLTSLAEQVRVKTPQDLPDPAIHSVTNSNDPLFTKEVDDGLEQLLADWSLFKKSGFLGRGPNGSNHPLFEKISALPVPMLLAGRFDGATQEVRQSITDYMNGWRYEQGIVYEQGETFERYLRRVIRHILDLQKKRKG